MDIEKYIDDTIAIYASDKTLSSLEKVIQKLEYKLPSSPDHQRLCFQLVYHLREYAILQRDNRTYAIRKKVFDYCKRALEVGKKLCLEEQDGTKDFLLVAARRLAIQSTHETFIEMEYALEAIRFTMGLYFYKMNDERKKDIYQAFPHIRAMLAYRLAYKYYQKETINLPKALNLINDAYHYCQQKNITQQSIIGNPWSKKIEDILHTPEKILERKNEIIKLFDENNKTLTIPTSSVGCSNENKAIIQYVKDNPVHERHKEAIDRYDVLLENYSYDLLYKNKAFYLSEYAATLEGKEFSTLEYGWHLSTQAIEIDPVISLNNLNIRQGWLLHFARRMGIASTWKTDKEVELALGYIRKAMHLFMENPSEYDRKNMTIGLPAHRCHLAYWLSNTYIKNGNLMKAYQFIEEALAFYPGYTITQSHLQVKEPQSDEKPFLTLEGLQNRKNQIINLIEKEGYDPYKKEMNEPKITSEKKQPEETSKDAMQELNDLIGLTEVKQEVTKLVNFVKIQKMREKNNLKTMPISKHLVFSGNPGTGKTTVARILAKVYKEIGLSKNDHVVEVDRASLVAGYIGQTAIKTKEKIDEAMGGVLFIDEAYTLSNPASSNDFGQEAIDTILKAMEDYRDDLVVIVAGYEDKMETFIHSNPGLESRFNNYIHFEDYHPNELVGIFYLYCKNAQYQVDPDAKKDLQAYFDHVYHHRSSNFANGRTVRNFFEKVITEQVNRISLISNISLQDTSIIKKEDILKVIQSDSTYKTETVDVMKELENLVGLDLVKEEVKNLINFAKVQKMRKEKNLKPLPMSNHLVFSGNPGTGKTTVARILATIYKELGILKKGHLVEVDRSDLVAGYIGQTALKTSDKIQEAMGGVLFIDEAYTLSNSTSSHDFGQEAIDTILKAMEDYRDQFIVIVAGYEEEMKTFINSNTGLKSRFNKYIHFEDYEPDALESLFYNFCKQAEYVVDEDAKKDLRLYIEHLYEHRNHNFANGRTIRNFFENVLTAQINRISSNFDISDDKINVIQFEDINTVTSKDSSYRFDDHIFYS